MSDSSIYKDIAKRTGGDIYIGVVGPVRTGKSTFISKFLDTMILPNIENEYDRERAQDEVPQSGSGKSIMTTEPKFVPNEAVKIKVSDDSSINVRLIDCVGYLIDGAIGATEEGESRMVNTPWSEDPMPFEKAAEIGTSKVICEHSTIGILVTTDGTTCDIPRENYVKAEERVANELKNIGKPFAILLNSRTPESDEARNLAIELENKYNVPVALLNCKALNKDDVTEILGLVLSQFPIKEIKFNLPEWTDVLSSEHRIHREALEMVVKLTENAEKLGDIDKIAKEGENLIRVKTNPGEGTAEFSIPVSQNEYYTVISELSGLDIDSEKTLVSTIKRLSDTEREYKKIESALNDVKDKGYGIVMPDPDEMVLDTPKITRQGGGWGVKVSATANSIHMIKAGIRAELCPVVGTEEQTEEVVKYLVSEYEDDPKKVWQSNMFGKSLYDLVNDGMNMKLLNIPNDSREKIGETLEKIVNDGANGMICILL